MAGDDPTHDGRAAVQGRMGTVSLVSLIGLAVAALACLGVGTYLLATHRLGYTRERLPPDTVDCEDLRGLSCTGVRWVSFVSSTRCHANVRCTLTGGFGTLSRVYRDGQEPRAGQPVDVYTAPSGEKTLEPGSVPGVGIGLVVAAAVLAVLWLVAFRFRRSRWSPMLRAVGEVLD
jgi:hypothetical protein